MCYFFLFCNSLDSTIDLEYVQKRFQYNPYTHTRLFLTLISVVAHGMYIVWKWTVAATIAIATAAATSLTPFHSMAKRAMGVWVSASIVRFYFLFVPFRTFTSTSSNIFTHFAERDGMGMVERRRQSFGRKKIEKEIERIRKRSNTHSHTHTLYPIVSNSLIQNSVHIYLNFPLRVCVSVSTASDEKCLCMRERTQPPKHVWNVLFTQQQAAAAAPSIFSWLCVYVSALLFDALSLYIWLLACYTQFNGNGNGSCKGKRYRISERASERESIKYVEWIIKIFLCTSVYLCESVCLDMCECVQGFA